MANKRLIRVIIYEGPEEIIDLYEKKALKGTRRGGVPKIWEDREYTHNIKGFIKLTAETVEPVKDDACFTLLDIKYILVRHEKAVV